MGLLKKARKAVSKVVSAPVKAVAKVASGKTIAKVASKVGGYASGYSSVKKAIGKNASTAIKNAGIKYVGGVSGMTSLGLLKPEAFGFKSGQAQGAFNQGSRVGRGIAIGAGLVGGAYLAAPALGGAGGAGSGGALTSLNMPGAGMAGGGIGGGAGMGGGLFGTGIGGNNILGALAMGYGLYGQNKAAGAAREQQQGAMENYQSALGQYQANMGPVLQGEQQLGQQIGEQGAQYQQMMAGQYSPYGLAYQRQSQEMQRALAGQMGGQGIEPGYGNPMFAYQAGDLQAKLAAQAEQVGYERQFNLYNQRLGTQGAQANLYAQMGNQAGMVPGFQTGEYPYFPQDNSLYGSLIGAGAYGLFS